MFPIFDCAYQGFASGDLDLDAWSIRYFVKAGFEMLVCQSFSKNFGLYSMFQFKVCLIKSMLLILFVLFSDERIGNLILVLRDATSMCRSRSQIELIIRTMFSNPPSHGQRIVATTLGSTTLKQEWYVTSNNGSSAI